jgi:uncharacterized protein (UPF0548 family)
MAIRFRRPSAVQLGALATANANTALSYAPVGLCAGPTVPNGFRHDRWSRPIGTGDAAFERAVDALMTWKVHEGAGLAVAAPGPASTGLVVAMAAPLPAGWVDVVCRVVDVVDLPRRKGFAYGTLPTHPEQGEEAFTVVLAEDQTVIFEIVAVSRPRQVLARLCPPVARRLQIAATNRYFDAITAAAAAFTG